MAKLDEQLKTFAGIVGDAHVMTDAQSLSKYSVDGVTPKAVIAPADIDQMSEVVRYAYQQSIRIAPYGSGSKMSLGYPPKSLDMVILTTRLNHMVDVDSANLTVTMQAGVGFKESQAMLSMQENRCYLPLDDPETESDRVVCSERANIGAFVPFDPMFSDSATIGGILATNSNRPPAAALWNAPRPGAGRAFRGPERRYHRSGRQNREKRFRLRHVKAHDRLHGNPGRYLRHDRQAAAAARTPGNAAGVLQFPARRFLLRGPRVRNHAASGGR